MFSLSPRNRVYLFVCLEKKKRELEIWGLLFMVVLTIHAYCFIKKMTHLLFICDMFDLLSITYISINRS